MKNAILQHDSASSDENDINHTPPTSELPRVVSCEDFNKLTYDTCKHPGYDFIKYLQSNQRFVITDITVPVKYTKFSFLFWCISNNIFSYNL